MSAQRRLGCGRRGRSHARQARGDRTYGWPRRHADLRSHGRGRSVAPRARRRPVPRGADGAPARLAHDPARRLPGGDRPAPARRHPRLPRGRRHQRDRPRARRRRGQARPGAPAHRGRALLDPRGHLHPRDPLRDGLRHRARGVGAGHGLHPGPFDQRRAARARRLARPRPPDHLRPRPGGARPRRPPPRAGAAQRPAPGAGDPLLAAALHLRRRELAGAGAPHPPGLHGGLHGRLRAAGHAGHRRPRHGGPGWRADPAARPGQRRAAPGDALLRLRGGDRPSGRHRRHHRLHLRRRRRDGPVGAGGRVRDPGPGVRDVLAAPGDGRCAREAARARGASRRRGCAAPLASTP